ncbi:hypothetical protein [Clostridium uliginosum]|uniref:Uncharacterized protein n=1 Tax=Clostridium uliginosum TaxID=119641 RepID=A0A1I1NP29_9CLOT|nr:hypothetical protein [Clostridium uliginosum]SFC96513.1 hypothetical protein SAMN05421842_11536 [Clostridium uliginosum]
MNKRNKGIITIIFIIVALFQSMVIFYIKSNEKLIKSTLPLKVTYSKNHKTLEDFNKKLQTLDNCYIVGAKEVDDKWYIKINIQGNKDILLEKLSYLSEYDINDYKFEHNKDKSSLTIELSDKDLEV